MTNIAQSGILIFLNLKFENIRENAFFSNTILAC